MCHSHAILLFCYVGKSDIVQPTTIGLLCSFADLCASQANITPFNCCTAILLPQFPLRPRLWSFLLLHVISLILPLSLLHHAGSLFPMVCFAFVLETQTLYYSFII